MTLDHALQMAFLTSRNLKGALIAYDRARGGVREAKSALLPQIGIGAQATQFDRANVIDFGAMMGGPSLPMTIAHRWNPAAVASLSVQIDISGAVRAASNQAEFMALAARIDVDRVRNQLAYDVRSSYYDALRAHGQLKVAEDHAMAAETRLKDARTNEQVGNVPKFDVVSAERDVAEAKQGVLAARSHEALAIARLKNIIGAEQSSAFEVDFEPAGPAPADDIVADAGALVSEAMKLRPEVLELQAVVEAAKHGLHYARRSTLPSLSAGLAYNYQPNNGAFTLPRTASATVSLSIPLFDGGLARARVSQAQADRDSAENNYRSAVELIDLEVRSALIELIQASARISVAEAGVAQAQEAFRLASIRYRVGVTQSSVVSPQLELTSAQAALTSAANNRVNALIDHRLAQARLDFAMGKFAQLASEKKP